jgi:precorrin-3B synthase
MLRNPERVGREAALQEVRGKRKGWCPSVHLPMAAGDGLIVRIHGGFRAFSAGEARAIAELSARHGNGLVELTRRANLQLRGVSEPALAGLQAELITLGLAFGSVAEERRLALLVSPLSEVESSSAPLLSLGAALQRALAAAHDITNLPAKFGVIVDGDGEPLAHVPADIRVRVYGGSSRVAHLSVGDSDGELLLGAMASEDVPRAVLACMRALCAAGGLRMRELVHTHGVQSVRALVQTFVLAPAQKPLEKGRALALGVAGTGGAVGLALPFGVGEAEQWRTLATLSEKYGRGALRVTPMRSVLVLGVSEGARGELVAEARARGFITDDRDLLRHVVACTGAPACAAAFHDTRGFARELGAAVMPYLSRGLTLHVSGCEKSCAHGGAADLTVVHTREGMRLGFQASVAQASVSPVLTRAQLVERLVERARELEAFPSDESDLCALHAPSRGLSP